MKTRTLIVDDEIKAIEILKNKIERFCPSLEIVGTTQNPDEVKEMIQQTQPHLVFMDIAMPRLSGFDVLKGLPEHNFELIFVTAFDQYAIQAIENSAIGYLLKPVSNEKLIRAVNVAEENIKKENAVIKNQNLLQNLSQGDVKKKKIVIPVQEGLELIDPGDIKHIEGDDGYSNIHLKDKPKLISSYRIGHFAQLLDNQNFFLTHRSHLVNLDYVTKYLNEGYLILSSGEEIPVSRSRKSELLELLKA